jgi:hypothetical protein
MPLNLRGCSFRHTQGHNPATGEGRSDAYYLVNGEKTHGRTVSNFARHRKQADETSLDYVRRTVDPQAHWMRNLPVKHRYILPLNKTTRRVLRHLHQSYPRRIDHSSASAFVRSAIFSRSGS